MVKDLRRSFKTKEGRIIWLSVALIIYIATLLGPSLNAKNDIILHSPLIVGVLFLYTYYKKVYVAFNNQTKN